VKIADSTVLVTGANRGLGSALVEEALRRGAKRIYAGGRQPFVHADRRVVPLVLDVTDAAQIRAGVEKVDALNIRQQCRYFAAKRPERSCRARAAPGGQSLWHI
jgi:NAD(P)-dependent dehydrogenase (short-subunit alcohol dehydrogenase family)